MTECDTYPNEGPLWPCGCLMGDPMCQCDTQVLNDELDEAELAADELAR